MYTIPSKKILAQLKKFEGFSSHPYLCPAGKATIGYGTNLEAHPELIPFKAIRQSCQSRMLTGQSLVQSLKKQCMLWTSTIAETSMICEIIGIKADLERCCPAYTILVDKGEYIRAEALLDMAYNMGVGIAPHGGKKGSGLLGFYTFLPRMERGVYIEAAEGLKCSRWYQQVERRCFLNFLVYFSHAASALDDLNDKFRAAQHAARQCSRF